MRWIVAGIGLASVVLGVIVWKAVEHRPSPARARTPYAAAAADSAFHPSRWRREVIATAATASPAMSIMERVFVDHVRAPDIA